jgi:hypothetical protein
MAHTEREMLQVTQDQVRRFRMQRSGLIDGYDSPETVASALAGVQAQILPAAGLALWNRTRGLTNKKFERLLFEKRTLVKLWGQRGTLHVYPSNEWPLLHSVRAVNRTWWEHHAVRESGDFGDYRHLVDEVADELRRRDSMGRKDLRALELDLHEELFSGWGGIFADLVRLGYACHAGKVGGEGHFAHRERWLPDLEWNPPDPDDANIEIVRRYFANFAPATVQDAAYWRGIDLQPMRRWIDALGDELVEVEVDGARRWMLRRDLDFAVSLPDHSDGLPLRMLYRFDPLLLGIKDKRWIVDPQFYNRVWRPAGHIEGVVLHRGRGVATWRYDWNGSGMVVTVSPFKRLPKTVTERIPRQAEGVARFFGAPLHDLRYAEDGTGG